MLGAKPKQVPVTILTGFLGAGKTTLMNHILQSPDHKLRFAIIENEFGKVNVDEKILAVKEETEEDIVEVMNGCICCSWRGDLVAALDRIYKKVKSFDAVIIETTGLADPGPVVQTFMIDESIKEKFRLDGVITVVDSKHVLKHLEEEKPEGVVNEAVEQLAFADRVLLNKTDLVDAAQLDVIEMKIKGINSTAEIFRTEQSKMDPRKLLNIGAFNLDRILEVNPEFVKAGKVKPIHHDKTVSSVSWKFEGDLNMFKLRFWINELIENEANDFFRYKGVISVKGMDHKWVFQGVHMLIDAKFADAKWRKGEKRECRFVFIGRNLNKQALEDGFNACKVTEGLRFAVGAPVLCMRQEGFAPGKVLKQWDDGNCYRVRLDSGIEVWAPIDDDDFIRAP